MINAVDAHVRILRSALAMMRGSGPQNLVATITFRSGWESPGDRISSEDELLGLLSRAGPNDPLRTALHEMLALWDFARLANWAGATESNTVERRRLIYEHLSVSPAL